MRTRRLYGVFDFMGVTRNLSCSKAGSKKNKIEESNMSFIIIIIISPIKQHFI